MLVLKIRESGPSFGAELGVESLFTSVIDGDLTSSILLNRDTDREWDIYMNPVLEFSKPGQSLFFQYFFNILTEAHAFSIRFRQGISLF